MLTKKKRWWSTTLVCRNAIKAIHKWAGEEGGRSAAKVALLWMRQFARGNVSNRSHCSAVERGGRCSYQHDCESCIAFPAKVVRWLTLTHKTGHVCRMPREKNSVWSNWQSNRQRVPQRHTWSKSWRFRQRGHCHIKDSRQMLRLRSHEIHWLTMGSAQLPRKTNCSTHATKTGRVCAHSISNKVSHKWSICVLET